MKTQGGWNDVKKGSKCVSCPPAACILVWRQAREEQQQQRHLHNFRSTKDEATAKLTEEAPAQKSGKISIASLVVTLRYRFGTKSVFSIDFIHNQATHKSE